MLKKRSTSNPIEFPKSNARPGINFGCTGRIGPGYYQPPQTLRTNQNIRGGVISGKVGETFIIDAEIPGPGRYTLPAEMTRKIPGVRYKDPSPKAKKSRKAFPGPARYDQELTYESDYMRGCGFTKGRRNKSYA